MKLYMWLKVVLVIQEIIQDKMMTREQIWQQQQKLVNRLMVFWLNILWLMGNLMRQLRLALQTEMEFGCQAPGKYCYEITYLSCQGEVKSDAVPINLFFQGDCAGLPWCLSKCSNANPSMWDMPFLLAIDGCDVYED